MTTRQIHVVLALAAAFTVPTAGVAHASPRDEKAGSTAPLPVVNRHTARSADDSTPIKTVAALCAADEWVIGGGAMTAGANGQVRLTKLAPDYHVPVGSGTRSGYTATAAETTTSTVENWYLLAWAACAKSRPT